MQTMRNWLIGYYIVELEQCGKDRAEYGTQLLKNLEERVNRKGLTTTLFKWARKFYRLYPQMTDNLPIPICATVMHQFVTPGKILELGKGFCFEARQKRIIIDDEYYYPDLVFYNRILHCGVIIELKNEEFSHENLGQLNAYVSHYREHEMQLGDNPPIGILPCTRKGKKMVEYALAGMDNQLFVSTYMLQLPDKKTLENFLLKQLGK